MRSHQNAPPPFRWSLIAILLVILGAPGSAKPRRVDGSIPKPYPVARYRSIWEPAWFASASVGETPEEEVAAAVFPFTLSGVAEWRGKAYIYLTGEDKRVYELAQGEPRGDLELLETNFGQSESGHRALVRYRLDYFELEFDLQRRFVATLGAAPVVTPVRVHSVKISIRRLGNRSNIRSRFENSRPSRKAERETLEWLDGWFRD
jgi:hypothetical protein